MKCVEVVEVRVLPAFAFGVLVGICVVLLLLSLIERKPSHEE